MEMKAFSWCATIGKCSGCYCSPQATGDEESYSYGSPMRFVLLDTKYKKSALYGLSHG